MILLPLWFNHNGIFLRTVNADSVFGVATAVESVLAEVWIDMCMSADSNIRYRSVAVTVVL